MAFEGFAQQPLFHRAATRNTWRDALLFGIHRHGDIKEFQIQKRDSLSI
jgi:hypothetical protein